MVKRKTVTPKIGYSECQNKTNEKTNQEVEKHLGEKPSCPQPAQPALKLCSSYIPFYKSSYKCLREEDIPELSLAWGFPVAWYELEFPSLKTGFLPTQWRVH